MIFQFFNEPTLGVAGPSGNCSEFKNALKYFVNVLKTRRDMLLHQRGSAQSIQLMAVSFSQGQIKVPFSNHNISPYCTFHQI